MKEVFFISMAVASVSTIVADATLFQPFREWTKKRVYLLGKLFSCGWCLSVWVSLGFTALYDPFIFWSQCPFMDYFLTAMVISWMAAFQWLIFSILMKTSGK